MALIPRSLFKIFGSAGGTAQFGRFGSDAAGAPTTTKDPDSIQSLTQYDDGWYAATANSSEPPRIQDMNGLFFLFAHMMKYLFQKGIPEYIATEEYYPGVSLCQDEGIVWVLKPTATSPTTGSQPSLNQDEWDPVSVPTVPYSTSSTEILDFNFKNVEVEADTSLGDITLTVPDPEFLGQDFIIAPIDDGICYVRGSGTIDADGYKSGIYDGGANTGLYVTKNHRVHGKAVEKGGVLVWQLTNEKTAEYLSSGQNIDQYSDGEMEIVTNSSFSSSIASASGSVFAGAFSPLTLFAVPFSGLENSYVFKFINSTSSIWTTINTAPSVTSAARGIPYVAVAQGAVTTITIIDRYKGRF